MKLLLSLPKFIKKKVSMQQVPDNVICSLLKCHQEKGMEYLFDKYYRALVLWAVTFLYDISKAEDVVQDFLVKVWEHDVGRNLEPKTLKSFLYTSVRNLTFDRMEKNDPLRETLDLAFVQSPWEEYDYFKDNVLQAVKAEVAKLPHRSREVITCVYLKGMSYKDTATELGISVATVNTLLVHALKKMRENTRHLGDLLCFLWVVYVEREVFSKK